MAGTFRVGFAIEGDASDAINAINNLAKALDRISTILEKFAKTSERAGQRARASARQAEEGFERTANSARAIVPVMNQVYEASNRAQTSLARTSQALQTTPQMPNIQVLYPYNTRQLPAPATATGAGGAGGTGGIGANIAAASNAINRPPNFGAWITGFTNTATSAAQAGRNILSSFGTRTNAALSLFATKLVNASYTLGNMLNGLRLVGQGITNFGRAMFFFISLPLATFFTGIIRTAVAFDDAMIRVRKTANLTSAETKTLTGHLRNLAKYIAMSHVELAGIAEVIGQAGVQSVKSIGELTEVFAMLAITTDLTADSAADSMVKIANAFQWNLNKSTDEVWRLANVINKLENDTAASAAEITNTLAGWSQVATTLRITAYEAAALSAVLVSLGISSDEAATALRNMGIYLGRNADVIAQVMGTNEKYSTQAKVLTAINEDAVQVYMDLAMALDAYSESGKNAEAIVTSMDVANIRGGRGLTALTQNIGLVGKTLNAANKEWNGATSLAREYNMAMESTKNQTQVLKNNISDVGITIGQYVLPYINKMIQIAIPAIQKLGDSFSKLSEKGKITALAIMGLLVVGGPLVMLFGQLFHGVILIALGMLMLARSMATGIALVGRFVLAITKVGKFLLGWPGIILGATVAILKILTSMGVDVAGFFMRLGQAAVDWGENLAQQISIGFVAGAVRYVTQAINWVANLIASFFEGHSPPKSGPLSTIDTWGSAVLQAYLKGFAKADFGVLEDIGRKIETILTRGVENDAMAGALEAVAKARVDLAAVIDKFNTTGILDEGMLNTAVAGLGDMADEMSELVRLNLEYNALQKQLDDIEKQRKGLNNTYKAEIESIAGANMSLEEKVAAMRNAQRTRDAGLSKLGEEEDSLKEQQKLIQEQRDLMNAMVESMMKQDDLFARIADTLERMAGAGSDLDIELPNIGGGFDASKYEEEIAKAEERIRTFVEKVEEGKRILEGFFTGMSGGEKLSASELFYGFDEGFSFMPTDEQAQGYGFYTMLYDMGEKAKEIQDTISKWKTEIETAKSQITGFFDKLNPATGEDGKRKPLFGSGGIIDFGSIGQGIMNSPVGEIITLFWDRLSPAIDRIGEKFEWVKTIFQAVGSVISWMITPIKNAWTTIGGGTTIWQSLGNIAMGVIRWLAQALGWLLGVIVDVVGWLVAGLSGIIAAIVATVVSIFTFIAGVIGFIVGIVNAVVQFFKGDVEGALTSLSGAWQAFLGVLASVIGGAIAFLIGLGSTIWGVLGGIVSAIWNFIVLVWDNIKAGIRMWINAVKDRIDEFKNTFKSIIDKVKEVFGINSPSSVFSDIGKNIIGGLLEGLKNSWTSIVTWVSDKAQWIVDKFKIFLGIKSPSKVFEDIGLNTMMGLKLGLESGTPGVYGQMDAVAKSMVPTFQYDTYGGNETTYGGIVIKIGELTVRDDKDIEKLADAIERRLAKKSRNGAELGRTR